MDKRLPFLLVLVALTAPARLHAARDGGELLAADGQGSRGAADVRGPRGPRGFRGRRGPRGFRGLRGPQGAAGPQGPQGEEGLVGADGPMGFPGPRGTQGATGPQGAPGTGLGRPGYTSSTVDGSGGRLGAVAIGADGLGLITYDGGNALDVAHCSDLACTTSTTSTIDTCSPCELYTSVTIGADGLGLIVVRELLGRAPQGRPLLEHRPAPRRRSSTLGGPENNAFETTSVAIGSDGLGLIAFLEPKGLVPKVAHCENVACSNATISSIDPTGRHVPGRDLGHDRRRRARR